MMKYFLLASLLFSINSFGSEQENKHSDQGVVKAIGLSAVSVVALPAVKPAILYYKDAILISKALGSATVKVVGDVDNTVGRAFGEERGYLQQGVGYLGEKTGLFSAIYNATRNEAKDNVTTLVEKRPFKSRASSAFIQ